jgi:hypothetical protein
MAGLFCYRGKLMPLKTPLTLLYFGGEHPPYRCFCAINAVCYCREFAVPKGTSCVRRTLFIIPLNVFQQDFLYFFGGIVQKTIVFHEPHARFRP